MTFDLIPVQVQLRVRFLFLPLPIAIGDGQKFAFSKFVDREKKGYQAQQVAPREDQDQEKNAGISHYMHVTWS